MRISVISLITAALLFALTIEAQAKTYSDVSTSHKNYTAIMALSDESIIRGYDNGTFGPEKTINRAEAVKILVKSTTPETDISSALNWHLALGHSFALYPDVKIKEWFTPFVEVATKKSIVKGYPDGTFKPGNSINFAEALKVILETYDVDTSGIPYVERPLLFVKQGDWFEKYFTYAYTANLINRNKFYHPGQLITRGEFTEIMYRVKTLQNSRLAQFPESSTPTSNEYTITIPRLNIVNLQVSFADPSNEKGALDVLKRGLGHYLATPGSGKKMVLFGHSSGYSWDNSPYKTVLKHIDQISSGDKVYINYHEKGYGFEIFKSSVIPATQDKQLLENQNSNELALYTCWPPNSIKYRYVVFGKPIS